MEAAKQERGFALIMALVATLVLALIAWAVMALGHTDARLARNAAETARLTGIADAAINITLLRLLQPSPAAPLQTASPPATIVFEGQAVQVSVQDEMGKVDLNYAPAAMLQSLWVSLGMDLDAAQALADKMLDWRESGAGKQLNGVSAEAYLAAGRSYEPRRGPFESVDEAKLILGLPPAAFTRLMPLVTVYAQQPFVDVNAASPAVLRALPQDDQARVADILDRPQIDGLAGADALSPGVSSNSITGRVYTIIASAVGSRGVRVTRTATSRLTGLTNQPYWTYQWK